LLQVEFSPNLNAGCLRNSGSTAARTNTLRKTRARKIKKRGLLPGCEANIPVLVTVTKREEEEEESGSEFSDDEETTIDASTMEESSGEEVDFENQRYKVPKSTNRNREEFQLDGWAAGPHRCMT
jgi:hypothetical protein